MIIIVHPHDAVSDYDRALFVDVGEACPQIDWDVCLPHHRQYTFLDTPFGTFKRSVNYWFGSPYGWSAVSWG